MNQQRNKLIESINSITKKLQERGLKPLPEINRDDAHGQMTATLPTKKAIPLWSYVTSLAVIVGILGGLAEVLNFIDVFPKTEKEKSVMQLTVFVTDSEGNVVLENEGRLNIPLGNRSLNEPIGTHGRTNFPDIPESLKGEAISIGLDAEGWEVIDGSKKYIFTGTPIHLKVRKDRNLGVIQGIVKTSNGQSFIPGAQVLINTDTVVFTDDLGVFKANLPEKMLIEGITDSYSLTVSKEGFSTECEYYNPRSTPIEFRLKTREL